jgi:hypothetical protein
MTADHLKAVLDAHALWLKGEGAGQMANLREAYLHGAYLHGAYLRGADLREANLRGADLSGAQGIFDPCAWIAANCKRVRGGIEAYKIFGLYNQPPESWKQEPGAEISEVVNPNPTDDCGSGVNVATLDWVRRHNDEDLPIWKVLVKWEWMVGAVVPYATDGKFRVPRAKLVEVVETTEVKP